jgi:hypothetical protein
LQDKGAKPPAAEKPNPKKKDDDFDLIDWIEIEDWNKGKHMKLMIFS